MLVFDHIAFPYPSSKIVCALDDVSLSVEVGERVMLLGANGSGKSTLARMSNGTLLPQKGSVTIDGLRTDEEANLLSIRQRVGMVGQEPEAQIISSRVIDDVAFGPENLGLDREEIRRRVDEALALVGMDGFQERDPSSLSGGEMQRLVIAGAYALLPQYLVFDEPTSMLDLTHRREVLHIIDRLHERGCGILHVTHDLSDCLGADRICVLAGGRIVFEGDLDALVARQDEWRLWGLAASPLLALELGLREEGRAVPFTSDVPALAASLGLSARASAPKEPMTGSAEKSVRDTVKSAESASGQALLECRELVYDYRLETAQPHRALDGVSFRASGGSLLLVAGETGSGKSTLLRLLAGLYDMQAGTLELDGTPPRPGLSGMVFQIPESQLFADTVAEDILFGPTNMGQIGSGPEASAARDRLVADALEAVGLASADISSRSPYELSGGQMRRVAIAGVLAMHPRLLLLDEPTAGLDAQGRALIGNLLAMQVAAGALVIAVSHDLEWFLPLADEVLLLKGGATVYHGPAASLRDDPAPLRAAGLELPPLMELSDVYGFDARRFGSQAQGQKRGGDGSAVEGGM